MIQLCSNIKKKVILQNNGKKKKRNLTFWFKKSLTMKKWINKWPLQLTGCALAFPLTVSHFLHTSWIFKFFTENFSAKRFSFFLKESKKNPLLLIFFLFNVLLNAVYASVYHESFTKSRMCSRPSQQKITATITESAVHYTEKTTQTPILTNYFKTSKRKTKAAAAANDEWTLVCGSLANAWPKQTPNKRGVEWQRQQQAATASFAIARWIKKKSRRQFHTHRISSGRAVNSMTQFANDARSNQLAMWLREADCMKPLKQLRWKNRFRLILSNCWQSMGFFLSLLIRNFITNKNEIFTKRCNNFLNWHFFFSGFPVQILLFAATVLLEFLFWRCVMFSSFYWNMKKFVISKCFL